MNLYSAGLTILCLNILALSPSHACNIGMYESLACTIPHVYHEYHVNYA